MWHYSVNSYIEQISAFHKCLKEKVLPSFDNLGEEYNKVFEEEFNKLGEGPAGPDDFTEPADLADTAQDKASDYYITMSNMKHGLIGLFTAGLFHLFEQQLYHFYNTNLRKYGEVEDKISKWDKTKEKFKIKGIDFDSFTSIEKVEELRLVANVIKHAEGGSSEKLKKLRPDYFMPDEEAPYYEIKANMPLAGEDLKIPMEDFSKYCEEVKKFWTDFVGRFAEARERIS